LPLEIGKIESIFKDIWEHDGAVREKATPYQNNFQKYTFWGMVGFFVLALLIAISTKIIGPFSWQKIVALLLVAFSQISALLYQLSFIFQGFKVFQEPTRYFLEPISKSSAKDYELATSLIRFDDSQLVYAKKRLNLESEQMKNRVGILVGAIDKVGIFPVAVTWGLAAYKYFYDGSLVFSQVDWLVYGLMGIYILAVPILFFVHKLELYTLVIDTAIELKKANNAINTDS